MLEAITTPPSFEEGIVKSSIALYKAWQIIISSGSKKITRSIVHQKEELWGLGLPG